MDILADIKHILHFLILFQCLLLASYLLFRLTKRKTSNIILVAFLLAKGLSELRGIFYFFSELNMAIFNGCPYLFYFPYPFEFLYVPLLYLYTLSLTRENFTFRKQHLWHGLLFAGFCIYLLVKYISISADRLRHIISPGPHLIGLDSHLYFYLGHIQFIFYAILSISLLVAHRQRLKETHSSIHRIDLAWLRYVIYGFIVWRSISIIKDQPIQLLNHDDYLILYLVSLVIFLFFISFMVIRGLHQPEIFLGLSNGISNKQSGRKPVSPEKAKVYLKYLLDFMATEKPYTDCDLTLKKLADMTDIPSRHISHVINKELHQNFYDFINLYRVEEVKKLLKESKKKHLKILALAFEAGFNSKSSFNSIFKKHTRMTPSEFQRSEMHTSQPE